eukprot:8377881-Pyramimonas_sp.AAC.1
MPAEVLERRDFLKGLGESGLGRPDWDTPELAFGLPSHPIRLPPDDPPCPMLAWGATNEVWGRRVVYTDGSGLANASPELRRCGWAVVELGP